MPKRYTYPKVINRPSFLLGMASIFDFTDSLTRVKFVTRKPRPPKDLVALAWEETGKQLRMAMQDYDHNPAK